MNFEYHSTEDFTIHTKRQFFVSNTSPFTSKRKKFDEPEPMSQSAFPNPFIQSNSEEKLFDCTLTTSPRSVARISSKKATTKLLKINSIENMVQSIAIQPLNPPTFQSISTLNPTVSSPDFFSISSDLDTERNTLIFQKLSSDENRQSRDIFQSENLLKEIEFQNQPRTFEASTPAILSLHHLSI